MMSIETNVWIYWLCCAFTMLLVIQRRAVWATILPGEQSAVSRKGKDYTIALSMGWLTSVLAAAGYVAFTHKYETGQYELSDLLVFSFSNGILEQFMFVFWLLVGAYIGKRYAPKKPKVIFGLGFTVYAVFSGLIHALFWTTVLPSHEPVTVLMAFLLTVMSFCWMWLFWRYQAMLAIISMHIVVDFFMISHLHFTWFEPLQALIQSFHSV